MRKPPIQTSNDKALDRQNGNGKCMIVDVQTHLHPPNWMKEMVEKEFLDIRSGKATATRWHGVSFSAVEDFTNLEKQMRVSAEAGVTHRLLGFSMIVTFANEAFGIPTIEAAKIHNDFHAQLREKYPQVIFPYGTVKPHDGKDAVREADRCIEKLGFKGLIIESSYGTNNRQYNHTVETFDFWEYVNDKSIPVFIHPPMLSYGWEWMDRYRFEETVARPNETALNASLMIMSGLFDRFPSLQIILPHMGGSLLMCLPRLQFGHRLGYEALYGYQQANIQKMPIEYAKKHFWVDIMGFYPPGIKHAIEVFGIERVLFGSDYGALPMSPKEHIDIVRNDLRLSEEDQNKILGLNAKKLFDLPDPA
jgi:predicted TIM-barrel fold metal-dependent hydrolase